MLPPWFFSHLNLHPWCASRVSFLYILTKFFENNLPGSNKTPVFWQCGSDRWGSSPPMTMSFIFCKEYIMYSFCRSDSKNRTNLTYKCAIYRYSLIWWFWSFWVPSRPLPPAILFKFPPICSHSCRWHQVTPGGLADRCGLKAGDAVLSLNGRPSDELEHEAAKQMILLAGTQVDLHVQR